jgi:DNA-directed RNA polymerase specialized sigma24 family protein
MGRLDSDLEDLYRRRHGAFQVMLASVTGSVESARDVVQEAFAQALRDQKPVGCRRASLTMKGTVSS